MDGRYALILGLAIGVASLANYEATALRLQRVDTEVAELTRTVASIDRQLASLPGKSQSAPSVAGPVRCSFDSDTIALIAAAVAKTNATLSPPSHAAPEQPPPPPRPLEAEQALVHADDLLKGAVERGRLTAEDAMAMRQALATAQATPDEQFEFHRRISQAINDGKLVPEGPHAIP